jgi:lysylphosphatidylglycerol synthase-like protein
VKTEEAPSPQRGEGIGRLRISFRFLVSALLTGGLSFFLLRQVDPRELGEWLRRVDRGFFAAYVALSIGGLVARSVRYRMLIGPRVGFFPLVLVTAARNFLVDLLPARIGSLSYIYLLTRRFGVPIEPVLSSFVLTFLYDLLAMTLLLGPALLLELGNDRGGAVLGISAAGLAAAVLAVFLRLAPGLRFLAMRLGRVPRFRPASARLDEVALEVERSGGGGRTIVLLLVSVGIRLLKFAAYWALLLGVLRHQGLGAAELPFWRVFLGIAGAELSATLPIHGVAGFGTYETAWMLGFTRLGLSREVAILSGFATHLLSQLYDYSTGLVALAIALAWSRRPK